MNRTALSVVALAVGSVLILGLYNIYKPETNSIVHDVFNKVHITRMSSDNLLRKGNPSNNDWQNGIHLSGYEMEHGQVTRTVYRYSKDQNYYSTKDYKNNCYGGNHSYDPIDWSNTYYNPSNKTFIVYNNNVPNNLRTKTE